MVSDRVSIEDQHSYMAAPLWHVMNPVDLGDGWFEVAYEGRALIWLLPKNDTEVKVQSWSALDHFNAGPYNSHLIYRGKECRGGEEERFETLIMPLQPGEDGESVKNTVRLEVSNERVLKVGAEQQILYGGKG